MSSTVESQNVKRDVFLWCLIVSLIAGAGVLGYYYLAEQSLLLTIIGYLGFGGLALVLAAKTTKGQVLWGLWKESVLELRKMVWPTRQETIQTTLAVLAMVFIMGLLLWSADFVLLRSVAWLTGHWGA